MKTSIESRLDSKKFWWWKGVFIGLLFINLLPKTKWLPCHMKQNIETPKKKKKLCLFLQALEFGLIDGVLETEYWAFWRRLKGHKPYLHNKVIWLCRIWLLNGKIYFSVRNHLLQALVQNIKISVRISVVSLVNSQILWINAHELAIENTMRWFLYSISFLSKFLFLKKHVFLNSHLVGFNIKNSSW